MNTRALLRTGSASGPFARAAVASLVGLGLGALAVVAVAGPPASGFPPDPPSHASAKQWIFDVAVANGKPSLERARAASADRPFETARVMGRFAVEFWVGHEILDRIRFDAPLLGTGPQQKNPRHPFPRPSFEDVTTHLTVQMADDPRAAFVQLVDRATGDTTRYAWPPEADGRMVIWTAPSYSDAAWPPPGVPPPSVIPDAGSADAK